MNLGVARSEVLTMGVETIRDRHALRAYLRAMPPIKILGNWQDLRRG